MELDEVQRILEQARDSLLVKVQEDPLLADAYDKMFNIGVKRMFCEVNIRLLERSFENDRNHAKA